MDVKFSTRNVRLSDRFEEYATEKVQKAVLQSSRNHELEVKVSREKDRYSSNSSSDRVELTIRSKDGVIRAEAEASDKYSAFDIALGRLSERVRRVRDRHKISRSGKHRPTSMHQATKEAFAGLDISPADASLLGVDTGVVQTITEDEHDQYADSPVIIRDKVFDAQPMTVDDALYQMELVGHDFYLFVDAKTDRPSVVYRRKGWDYGVIALNIS